MWVCVVLGIYVSKVNDFEWFCLCDVLKWNRVKNVYVLYLEDGEVYGKC